MVFDYYYQDFEKVINLSMFFQNEYGSYKKVGVSYKTMLWEYHSFKIGVIFVTRKQKNYENEEGDC